MADFEEAVLLLCDPPLDAACACLKRAMDGLGTDETALSFTLGGEFSTVCLSVLACPVCVSVSV